jgi:hypothetical protein
LFHFQHAAAIPAPAKRLEALLPWLNLKRISTEDFGEALAVLLGSKGPGLSVSDIARL